MILAKAKSQSPWQKIVAGHKLTFTFKAKIASLERTLLFLRRVSWCHGGTHDFGK
jgi:hypothetical protein